jgi:hypothetical protein
MSKESRRRKKSGNVLSSSNSVSSPSDPSDFHWFDYFSPSLCSSLPVDSSFIELRLTHLLILFVNDQPSVNLMQKPLTPSLLSSHSALSLPSSFIVSDLFHFYLTLSASKSLVKTMNWLEHFIQQILSNPNNFIENYNNSKENLSELFIKLLVNLLDLQNNLYMNSLKKINRNVNQIGSEREEYQAYWKQLKDLRPRSRAKTSKSTSSSSSLNFSSSVSSSVLSLLLIRSFAIGISFSTAEAEKIPRLSLNLRQILNDAEARVKEIIELLNEENSSNKSRAQPFPAVHHSDSVLSLVCSLSSHLKSSHFSLLFQILRLPVSNSLSESLLLPFLQEHRFEFILELIITYNMQLRFNYSMNELEYKSQQPFTGELSKINPLELFNTSFSCFSRFVVPYFTPHKILHPFMVNLFIQNREAIQAHRALIDCDYTPEEIRSQYPDLICELIYPAVRFLTSSGHGFELFEIVGEEFPESHDLIIRNLRQVNDKLSLVKYIRLFQLDQPQNSAFASANRKILQLEEPLYEQRLRERIQSQQEELKNCLSLPSSVRIIFVESLESVTAARTALRQELASGPIDTLGIDSESTFSPFKNKMALLQLATPKTVFLIDLLNYSTPVDQFVTELFESIPLKLGFNLVNDFKGLRSSQWETPLCQRREAFELKTIGLFLDLEHVMQARDRIIRLKEEELSECKRKKSKSKRSRTKKN